MFSNPSVAENIPGSTIELPSSALTTFSTPSLAKATLSKDHPFPDASAVNVSIRIGSFSTRNDPPEYIATAIAFVRRYGSVRSNGQGFALVVALAHALLPCHQRGDASNTGKGAFVAV